MTLTSNTMEWLNHNRHRSYPMSRDEWRKKVSPTSGLDCVLLDAIACNSNAQGDEQLELMSVYVQPDTVVDSEEIPGHTTVTMKYSDVEFTVDISGGETSGKDSYYTEHRNLSINNENNSRVVSISLVFSSHAYIIDILGSGYWELRCPVLKSRVVNLNNGFGVDGISTNGSIKVDGHTSPSVASGEVVLEDGFRTSPIILDGKVFVRVGKRFGKDPCKYDYGDAVRSDCRKPMFFFCGQNAINNGNIILKGGKGVRVVSGGSYTINDKQSKCNGKTIPCIEIIAGKELLDIYRPYNGSSDSEP